MNTDIEITDTLAAVFEHIDANRDDHLRRVTTSTVISCPWRKG